MWLISSLLFPRKKKKAGPAVSYGRQESPKWDPLLFQSLLLRYSDEAFIFTDIEGRISYWSGGAERLLGWRSEEALGEPMEKMVSLPESKEPGPAVRRWKIRRKDREERNVDVQALVYVNWDGNERGTLYILRDATRESILMEQLLHAERLSSVGQLVSGVAHEINNPLAGVLGFTQLLLRQAGIDEKTRDYLNKIYAEANRAKRVMENLLHFARHSEPQKSWIDIHDVLNKTFLLRAYEWNAQGQRLVKQFDPSYSEVWGDFNQLQQVFLNLMLNAEQALLDHGRGGTCTVSTKRILREEGGALKPSIQITFHDNGPGVPPEHIDKIFQPFFTTKGEKGTGLGLSISADIIARHHGTLVYQSAKEPGATFVINLPVRSGS
ncbi:MAG TPA: ATP-binding protein [Candidatus Manganitrophaceae bacterium]|nr:ATP-binding protein [Candidatus Manganitrophaceae bacterium]